MRTLISSLLLTCCLPAAAAELDWAESQAMKEIWVNPGFYSLHFQTDKGLNNRNPGLGIEYRYSTTSAVTAGRFYNSDRRYSNYIGWYYQPVTCGRLRMGVVLGAFDGYPKFQDGGWFPAIIPTASVEYERVGLNLAFVPSYKDRLYGALSFQVKVKVAD